MTRYERAAQLWSVLTFAARSQQILSYEIAGRLVGVPRQAVGNFLGQVQDYCLQKAIPAMDGPSQSNPSSGFGLAMSCDFTTTQPWKTEILNSS